MAHNHLPLWTIHPRLLNLRRAADLRPQHQPKNINYTIHVCDVEAGVLSYYKINAQSRETHPLCGSRTKELGCSKSSPRTTVQSWDLTVALLSFTARIWPTRPSTQYKFLPTQSTAIKSDFTPVRFNNSISDSDGSPSESIYIFKWGPVRS